MAIDPSTLTELRRWKESPIRDWLKTYRHIELDLALLARRWRLSGREPPHWQATFDGAKVVLCKKRFAGAWGPVRLTLSLIRV